MMLAWFSSSEIDRVLLAEEHLEQPAVRVEAGGIEDRVLQAEERAQRRLEVLVDLLRPADEAHGREPEAPLLHRGVRGRDHLGMVGESEVVVRTEVEDLALAVAHPDPRSLSRRQHSLRLLEARAADLLELCRERRPDRLARHGPSPQYRSTLPVSPVRIAANASSKRSAG